MKTLEEMNEILLSSPIISFDDFATISHYIRSTKSYEFRKDQLEFYNSLTKIHALITEVIEEDQAYKSTAIQENRKLDQNLGFFTTPEIIEIVFKWIPFQQRTSFMQISKDFYRVLNQILIETPFIINNHLKLIYRTSQALENGAQLMNYKTLKQKNKAPYKQIDNLKSNIRDTLRRQAYIGSKIGIEGDPASSEHICCSITAFVALGLFIGFIIGVIGSWITASKNPDLSGIITALPTILATLIFGSLAGGYKAYKVCYEPTRGANRIHGFFADSNIENDQVTSSMQSNDNTALDIQSYPLYGVSIQQ